MDQEFMKTRSEEREDDLEESASRWALRTGSVEIRETFDRRAGVGVLS